MGLITDPEAKITGCGKGCGEGSGSSNRSRIRADVSTQTLSASYIHSKSPHYAFTRSSLHLRLRKITAS